MFQFQKKDSHCKPKGERLPPESRINPSRLRPVFAGRMFNWDISALTLPMNSAVFVNDNDNENG